MSDHDAHISYEKSRDYWESVDASTNGVLGGFDSIAGIDGRSSKRLLERILAKMGFDWKHTSLRALDCGSGIGRVAKDVLSNYFSPIDLLEPNAHFIHKAQTSLESHQLGETYCQGLELFTPHHMYTCIWIQWTLNYITDKDIIRFLQQAATHLIDHGFIVVKENYTCDTHVVDEEDSSVTRTLKQFESLFTKSNLEIISQQDQFGFPADLFPVSSWVLVPLPAQL